MICRAAIFLYYYVRINENLIKIALQTSKSVKIFSPAACCSKHQVNSPVGDSPAALVYDDILNDIHTISPAGELTNWGFPSCSQSHHLGKSGEPASWGFPSCSCLWRYTQWHTISPAGEFPCCSCLLTIEIHHMITTSRDGELPSCLFPIGDLNAISPRLPRCSFSSRRGVTRTWSPHVILAEVQKHFDNSITRQ